MHVITQPTRCDWACMQYRLTVIKKWEDWWAIILIIIWGDEEAGSICAIYDKLYINLIYVCPGNFKEKNVNHVVGTLLCPVPYSSFLTMFGSLLNPPFVGHDLFSKYSNPHNFNLQTTHTRQKYRPVGLPLPLSPPGFLIHVNLHDNSSTLTDQLFAVSKQPKVLPVCIQEY